MLSGRLVVRPACAADGDTVEALQRVALRRLASSHYAASHIEAGLSHIGTFDPELIEDGTYYVAEIDGRVVGCGGWSFRARLLGTHRTIGGDPSRSLEPHHDAARIRAVFVHPEWTRQGIARRLVNDAEAVAQQAGFWRFVLVSTLNAEPLYRSLGYRSVERVFLDLPNTVRLPAIRMAKELPGPCADRAGADPMTSNAA